jgi:hypothetical protein
MKVDELFETPQHTFPTEFGLDQDDTNTKLAKEWLADKRKRPLEQLGGGQYTLYELPRAFILVDHEDQHNPKLVYAMQYKLAFHRFIGRQCAQQIAVWKDPTALITRGMATHIFGDHLLSTYKTVITDSMQTPDGQRFWDERIAEALSVGLYVYYVNLLPHREIIAISNVAQYKQLKGSKEIWGDESKHRARRIIITTSPL